MPLRLWQCLSATHVVYGDQSDIVGGNYLIGSHFVNDMEEFVLKPKSACYLVIRKYLK